MAPCIVKHCPPIITDHEPGCPRGACTGCRRRLTALGLSTCTACAQRVSDRLSELPGLYTALLDPSRIASVTGGGGSDLGTPSSMSDGALASRAEILALYRRWALRVSNLATGTGQHDIGWILALPAGPEFVDEVDLIWAEASCRAYPEPPEGLLIGPCPVGTPEGLCGGEVRSTRATADVTGGWATCRRCKTSANIDWWLAAMPVAEIEWLRMRPLLWHMHLVTGRKITESTVRSWSRHDSIDVRIKFGHPEYRVKQAVELARLNRGRGRPKADAEAIKIMRTAQAT
jgi:hypothetical protein